MKKFNELITEIGKDEYMTDAEVTVYGDKVKFDKNGVKSYDLKIVLDSDNGKEVLKDQKLKKAIIKYLGDAEIKKMLSVNPKGGLDSFEVYEADTPKMGFQMYIYLGSQKHMI